MARTVRILAALVLALSMLLAGAGVALAFNPPGEVSWTPAEFPGAAGQTSERADGAAWNGHIHGVFGN